MFDRHRHIVGRQIVETERDLVILAVLVDVHGRSQHDVGFVRGAVFVDKYGKYGVVACGKVALGDVVLHRLPLRHCVVPQPDDIGQCVCTGGHKRVQLTVVGVRSFRQGNFYIFLGDKLTANSTTNSLLDYRRVCVGTMQKVVDRGAGYMLQLGAVIVDKCFGAFCTAFARIKICGVRQTCCRRCQICVGHNLLVKGVRQQLAVVEGAGSLFATLARVVILGFLSARSIGHFVDVRSNLQRVGMRVYVTTDSCNGKANNAQHT